jgi:hypothetical protein
MAPGSILTGTPGDGREWADVSGQREEWSAVLAAFSDASIYQTRAYGEVTWPSGRLRRIVLRSGARVIAAAQVLVVKVPLAGLGVAYVRWGPLWQPRGAKSCLSDLEQLLEVLRDEYVGRQGMVLRVVPNVEDRDPTGASVRECLVRNGFAPAVTQSPYHTLRLDLSPPLAALRSNLDHKWRNQLNAAERGGLEVSEGESQELYGSFLELYDEMFARKRFQTSVDPRDFERVQSALMPSERLRILICRRDGELLSGLVASTIGATPIYLVGATGSQGMKSKASYLLQWRLIEWLKAMGCERYDLGGIDPDNNPGVYHFKKGIGGVETRLLGCFEAAPDRRVATLVRYAEACYRRLRMLRSNYSRFQVTSRRGTLRCSGARSTSCSS